MKIKVERITKVEKTAMPTLDLCPTCVSFMGQAIDELLNIILNVGVLGSCSELCGYLPNEIEATVCNLLCDYVGITGFIDLIDDADPDPIWICEEIGVCAVNDNAAANITNYGIQPLHGRRGATFTFSVTYQVTNTIGTGEVALEIVDPTGMGLGDGTLIDNQAPGTYNVQFSMQAQPSENEGFPNGVYMTEVAVCEGSCGSPHSHSFTLSVAYGNFTIKG
jgi:hypothetical protein